MQRVNIYITKPQKENMSHLSNIFNIKESEIVRRALEEYGNKYKKEIEEFTSKFNDNSNIITPLHKPNEEFINNCKKDPVFFLENAIKINTMTSEQSPFILWNVQKDLVNIIHEYNEIIINKSRQCGNTTINLAYILHYAICNPEKTICICGTNLNHCTELIRKINNMITNLPECIKPCIKFSDKYHIEFTNGVRIITIRDRSFNNIHSIKIDYFYVDEYREQERFDLFYNTTKTFYNTIKTLTNKFKIVISSTPYGFNEFFHIWSDALSNHNNFKPVCIPWFAVPERNEKWKNEMIENIGKNNFEREFECKFVGNNVLFPGLNKNISYSF